MEHNISTTQKPRLNLSKFCQMNVSRFLARRVPFRFSQMYLSCLGKLYYLSHTEERDLIRHTIQQVFEDRLSQPALEKLISRTFAGIFTHYQEKLFLAYAPVAKVKAHLNQRLRLEGTEELQKALTVGRGVILVTGHFGAVEFLPGALGLTRLPGGHHRPAADQRTGRLLGPTSRLNQPHPDYSGKRQSAAGRVESLARRPDSDH